MNYLWQVDKIHEDVSRKEMNFLICKTYFINLGCLWDQSYFILSSLGKRGKKNFRALYTKVQQKIFASRNAFFCTTLCSKSLQIQTFGKKSFGFLVCNTSVLCCDIIAGRKQQMKGKSWSSKKVIAFSCLEF